MALPDVLRGGGHEIVQLANERRMKRNEKQNKSKQIRRVKIFPISIKVLFKKLHFSKPARQIQIQPLEFFGFFFFRLRPSTFDGVLTDFFGGVFDLRGRGAGIKKKKQLIKEGILEGSKPEE